MKKTKIIVAVLILGFLGLVATRIISKNNVQKTQVTAPVLTVSAEMVRVGSINGVISYTGTVAGINEATVVSQTAGVIQKLLFKVGQRVSAGQNIAVIENSQQQAAVEQAKAQVLAAETAYEKAQNDLKRIQSLHDQNVATRDNLELSQLNVKAALAQFKGAQAALKVAEKQLADTYIKATISGNIATKEMDLGGTVAPGVRIAHIADLSKLKINISINEMDVPKISTGKSVKVIIDAIPDKVFEGKINTIGMAASMGTRSYPVEIILDNKSGYEIKSGMFARCELMADSRENTIIVPENAVIQNNDGTSNIFVFENGKAISKKVTLGLKGANNIEITSGLGPDAKVITLGKERLVNNMTVKEK